MSCLLFATLVGLAGCTTVKPVSGADDEAGTDTDTSGDDLGNPADEDTEEDTSIFIPDSPLESQCDPFMQDCPSGEKCVPYAQDGGNWNANKCVPVLGDGQPGDSCTWDGVLAATDDCGADSHCWDVMDVDGSLVGVCTSFCDGSADDPICGPQTACLIANEGSINLCIATCNPLTQDCGDGLGCFWANDNFQCIFEAGGIPTGEICGFINDCQPANLCASADVLPGCEGSACCAPYCDLVDPQCPIEGTECVAFFDEGTAPPTYEDVGVCILAGS